MIALMKKNLRLWGYGKAAALFIGCLLFSLGERVNGVSCYQQHILSAVSDHYYLTYFMLPMVLLSAFSFLDDDGEPVILRFESYHRYFLQKWFGTGLVALSLTVLQTAAILLSGIGLPSGNHWELAAGTIERELFSVLQQSFNTPAQTFIACTFYQLIGCWMIFGICTWINHFAGRRWSVGIIVALYLMSAVWIKVSAVQSLPVTGFNHLLILHHNLPHRLAVTGITAALIAALMALTVRFTWRRQLPHLQVREKGHRRLLSQAADDQAKSPDSLCCGDGDDPFQRADGRFSAIRCRMGVHLVCRTRYRVFSSSALSRAADHYRCAPLSSGGLYGAQRQRSVYLSHRAHRKLQKRDEGDFISRYRVSRPIRPFVAGCGVSGSRTVRV